MKKTIRLVSVVMALLMVFAVVLTACDNHVCEHVCPTCGKCTSDCTDPACADKCPGHEAAHVCEDQCPICGKCLSDCTDPVCAEKCPGHGDSYLNLVDYRAYMADDLNKVVARIGSVDNGEIDASIAEALEAGLAAINGAADVAAVKSAFDTAKASIANCIPLANGAFSYNGLSAAQKTEILGLLESYAISTGITGTTLYENGGYVMYNPRVTLGTEVYIPGYGFGTLAEGNITAPLANESTEAWKMYYHTISASDPGTINYLNDQGSETGDFYGYIGASAYTFFMNETKDGYEWTAELAAGDPEPLNMAEGSNQATKWRFEIRTDLKYSTLSSDPSRAAFNNRVVAPEDFITPFKLLLNQANNYYRGGELANATGAASIVGANAYYAATKSAEKGILSDEVADFSSVGVKVYEENGKWYFEYELGAAVTEYYAKYYIASSLYMPVPADFINLVGVDNYLGFNSDNTMSPVDNSLSLGAYVLERWDSNQQVVYKKNPNYVHASTKYAIEGVHINILTAAQTDSEAGIKEFLAGNTDSSGIPQTYLEEYRNDPRTRTTTGDSCFKLNMNALDAKTWELMFGEEGIVTQTPKENYWEVEPAMSNAHFRSALSYALNRNEFAAIKGAVSSVNYFSSNYMSDPENGISYNMTEAHQNAVAQLLDGTDSGGYSLELAREYFRMALQELEASGAYTPGTKDNPTVIQLEVAWQAAQQESTYHNYVKEYWETAFNDDSVHGGLYKLEVVFWVGTVWSDVYYQKMMLGQFDIGFGSISGNPLNPLSFMSVLSSDPTISGNFTLNWGADTNDPNAEILVYNGMRWSFDALYKAANELAIVENGVLVPAMTLGAHEVVEKTEESITVKLSVNFHSAVDYSIDDFVVFGYVEGKYWETSVWNCIVGEPVVGDGVVTYTLTIPASVYASLMAEESQGIDVHWSYSIKEHPEIPAVPSTFGGTYPVVLVEAPAAE